MATVVTVIPPFQVCHDGTVYGPGETAEVPDAVAARWQAHGWVEQQKKAPAKKADA
jgi:hypothetical protein